MLNIKNGKNFEPLQSVEIESTGGTAVSLRDGQGREYFRGETGSHSVVISGALGTHLLFLEDKNGKIIEETAFRVDCDTLIDDESGVINHLTEALRYTMESWQDGLMVDPNGSDGRGYDFISRFNGKTYRYFVHWLRDHVHTLKGQKYYHEGELKTAIELYTDTQREDGMVYDYVAPRNPNPSWRDFTFKEGDFTADTEDGNCRMDRIPVENDVEFLLLEGIYYTWKACGDDEWMAGMLDHAIKAVQYATTDKYRWSEKFKLLKRGYTIDTWDFMHDDDTALTLGGNVVDVNKTTFGIMHGDNTGFAVGCDFLAEMLEYAGRGIEAPTYRTLAKDIRERLEKIAWNGEFYTHHVSEDDSFKRDYGGTDPSRQVSLSNAYGMNRNIAHDKCVAIIKTYQRIRKEMPDSSPGEFYQIYPPFENGFGHDNGKWHYMNGGVGTIVAGELAHGAFEHGFESYGFDILKRVKGWGDAFDDFIPVAMRGCAPDNPKRSFETVDVTDICNVDLVGDGDPQNGVKGWTDEGGNDMRNLPTGSQTFLDIPFEVVDPAQNSRKAAVGLAYHQEGYESEAVLQVEKTAKSLYFLHTLAGGMGTIGEVIVKYNDGTDLVVPVHTAHQSRGCSYPGQITSWFLPTANWFSGSRFAPTACLAWSGPNAEFDCVGVYAWGWNNPHPEKEISTLTFRKTATAGKWFLLGVTASDQPVLFPSSDESFGIPDCWGSGAVVYAAMEGLAGVKDTGRAMDKVLVAPRWAASDSTTASVCVKIPNCQGYVRYNWRLDGNTMSIDLAATAATKRFELLLPEGRGIKRFLINGEVSAVEIKEVETSKYLVADLNEIAAYALEVELE